MIFLADDVLKTSLLMENSDSTLLFCHLAKMPCMHLCALLNRCSALAMFLSDLKECLHQSRFMNRCTTLLYVSLAVISCMHHCVLMNRCSTLLRSMHQCAQMNGCDIMYASICTDE